MEEWLHWTETCSHVIAQPYKNYKGATVHILHDPSVRKMWKALQVVVKHFMRADAANASPAKYKEAGEAVFEHSKLVQQEFA